MPLNNPTHPRWRSSIFSRGTCTSRPVTSACGKEHCATQTIGFAPEVVDAITAGEPISIEILYSDQVGLQRTISRFSLTPANDPWLVGLNRHWYLDWKGPRPESLMLAATEAIRRDQEAAAERRAHVSDGEAASDASESTRGAHGRS